MLKMKFFLMLGIVAMLASCSQNEEVLQRGNDEAKVRVTFNLKTENLPQTRAGVVGLTRYCIEIYAGTDMQATPVFSDYTNADGQFVIFLDKEVTSATILFWADYGDQYYDVTGGLQQILSKVTTATATKDESQAFFSKMVMSSLPDPTQPIDVTLKRAVSQVTLIETGTLEVQTDLNVSFDSNYTQFDVATESPIGTPEKFQINLPVSSQEPNAEIGHFYVLAPKAQQNLAKFIFTYVGLAQELANVPLQANYKTNITGKFDPRVEQRFKITSDDSWNTPDYNGSWLELDLGTSYPYTVNGKSYACIVVSAEYTKAGVAYTTKLPNYDDIADWNGIARNYVQAVADCQTLGGRLLTEAEFRIMVKEGIIAAGMKRYFLEGRKYGIHNSDGTVEINTSFSDTFSASFYLVFDIANPNL